MGPHADTAVRQYGGDVTAERRVQGEECVLGSRVVEVVMRGGEGRGGEGTGNYWLVASSIITVEPSAVKYTT